jgi:hypothetical protein
MKNTLVDAKDVPNFSTVAFFRKKQIESSCCPASKQGFFRSAPLQEIQFF